MGNITGNPILVLLGPTACGKTSLAARIAFSCNGEIISADSRQVYRDMNLGTGKDYSEYQVENRNIPYHLIDIADAGEKYSVFEYQKDFQRIYNDIISRGKLPLLCGGSGLYIDAVINKYQLVQVPLNSDLRAELADKSMDELTSILSGLKKLHNKSDITDRKRLVRAIEIEYYNKEGHESLLPDYDFSSVIFGLRLDVEVRRKKITGRLHSRLKAGMIDEVKSLMDKGVTPEQLVYYGLEYKFITQFLTGQIKYDEMVSRLNIAIHQFAKRQMTWFRKMEKEGSKIHWLDASLPAEHNLEIIKALLREIPEFSLFLP